MKREPEGMNPYEFENHEPRKPRHKLKDSDRNRRLILVVAVGLTILLLVALGIYWSEG